MKLIKQLGTLYRTNKLVRIFIYAGLILISLYLLLLIIVSIYINANKAKFITQVNEQIKNNIQGNVTIKNADIAVWRSFPRIAVVLQNISITDSVYHIPFLQMKQVDVRFGLLNIIGKKIRIGSVRLKDGQIHIFTDAAGYNNTYVVKGKPKPVQDTLNKKSLFIKNLELENVKVVSEHRQRHKRFEIKIRDLNADIQQKDSVYIFKIKENCFIKGLGFNLEKGSYLNNQTLEATWRVLYNMADRSISFDDTKVQMNEHLFSIKGSFWLKDPTHFSLHVNTKNLSYKQALQLMPQNVQGKLSNIQLSKPVNIVADVAGPMGYKTIPAVNVQWSTSLTELATPVTTLDSCSFSGSFTNQKEKKLPVSNENSSVVLNSFIGTWGDIALTGENIIVTNLTNPLIQFQLQSQCTFQQLDDKLALKTIHFLDGKAQLLLQYNGALIPDPALLNKLEVDLKMQNGTVEYEPRSLVFTNCNGEIVFSENKLLANNLQCDVKKNHFVVNIEGNDLSKLSSSVSGKADIVCSVFTPSLNLADFTGVFSSKKYVKRKSDNKQFASSAFQIDKILAQGSLQLNLKANQIQLNKFDARNAQAQLLFEENSWQIQQAFLQHANGSMNVSAKILETSADYRDATVKADIKNIDARKFFYAFNNFGQRGIEYQNLQGIVNSNANIAVKISSKGSVLPGTMQGTVDFSLKNGALINFEPIQKIKKYAFKNKDLTRVEFAELKDRFDINGYDITINRMEIQSSVLTLYVEGVYSLKNNTDISIQVPLSNMQKKEEDFKPANAGVNARAGPSIYLRARPDKNGDIKIGLDLFKKFKKEKSGKSEKNK